MELVTGGSLHQVLKRHHAGLAEPGSPLRPNASNAETLSLATCVDFAVQIAGAMSYLSQHGKASATEFSVAGRQEKPMKPWESTNV